MDLESHIRRAAGFALVLVLLATALIGVLAGIKNVLPLNPSNQIIVIIVLTLIFSAIFEPIRKQLQKLVDFIFYGGWYDYRSAVEGLTGGLENFYDQTLLGTEISRRIKDTLKPEFAFTILFTADGSILVYPQSDDAAPPEVMESLEKIKKLKIPIKGRLYQRLLEYQIRLTASPGEEQDLNESLSPAEGQFANFIMDKLTIPITDKDTLVGIFLLGPKIGGETYSSDDLNIMKIVARQVGVSIQNVRLLDEVKQRASEINKLHQEIVRAREEEQKRLARELHDEIIQALVGHNYQLSHLDKVETDRLKDDVRKIIRNVRRITSELRPPVLDNLGLVSAIRASVRRASSASDLSQEFIFNVDGEENDQLIPEDVATVIYRVFAEAFNNSLHHADAQRVQVCLCIQSSEVTLEVRDDGKGFDVPNRLGSFLSDSHFGLVGIRERVDLVNGTFEVKSNAGEGTSIRVQVPIIVDSG